jgi:hypothetical protein
MSQAQDAKQCCSWNQGERALSIQDCVSLGIVQVTWVMLSICRVIMNLNLMIIPVSAWYLYCAVVVWLLLLRKCRKPLGLRELQGANILAAPWQSMLAS